MFEIQVRVTWLQATGNVRGAQSVGGICGAGDVDLRDLLGGEKEQREEEALMSVAS